MEDLWQRVSGWVVAALLAVSAAFLGLWQRREKKDLSDLRKWTEELQVRADANKAMLMDHETRLQVAYVHIDGVKVDLAAIKSSITSLHTRISDGDKALNDKLDRLLERRKQ